MTTRLVTGTGRCGTGWAAAVLNACGVRAGHQAVVRHEHVLGRTPIDWGDYEVECSYEAAPLAATFDRVVVLIRDPFLVAASWCALGVFDDDSPGPYGDLYAVLDGWCPEVARQATPPARALVFWHDWNRLALDDADVVLPIDGLHPWTLLAALDLEDRYDPAAERVSTDVNARRHLKRPVGPVTLDDAPPAYRPRIVALADQAGAE